MAADRQHYESMDEYINTFPEDVRKILTSIRQTIKETAPEAQEAIKYQMPTFTLYGGNLVHFAAFKHHIGFYPTPTGVEEFKKDLSRYKGAKGSVQFPLDQPMPLPLIRRIVKYRVKEIAERQKKKK